MTTTTGCRAGRGGVRQLRHSHRRHDRRNGANLVLPRRLRPHRPARPHRAALPDAALVRGRGGLARLHAPRKAVAQPIAPEHEKLSLHARPITARRHLYTGLFISAWVPVPPSRVAAGATIVYTSKAPGCRYRYGTCATASRSALVAPSMSSCAPCKSNS
ncbi:hypothetical protein T492DRAFT_525687 [Pavlovales sp. CCMP2436]|nr:hypothetical protein T492DRAFT_525687 [Pavlovales sp. CCMP2436]